MAILTPYAVRFAELLQTFAVSENIVLTDDQLFDITGNLACDLLQQVVSEPSPDWHCILWGEEANEGEIYSLSPTLVESLACVKAQALDDDFEIESIELDDKSDLLVWSGEELYARVSQVQFEVVDPQILRRIQTLLSSIRVKDQQGLIDALATLPAWHVERHTPALLWMEPSSEPLKKGEWLTPYSIVLYEDKHSKELEQVPLPMWPTPNNMARLLQQLLSSHAPTPPKLSRCQEALARLFGADSWQTLLAKYRAYAIPHVTMRESIGDKSSWGLRFYRGADHLLGWVYDYARKIHAEGATLFIEAEWHSNRLALTHRLSSHAELVAAYRVAKGESWSPPTGAHSDSFFPDETEQLLRAQADEWKDYGSILDRVYASTEDIAEALEILEQIDG